MNAKVKKDFVVVYQGTQVTFNRESLIKTACNYLLYDGVFDGSLDNAKKWLNGDTETLMLTNFLKTCLGIEFDKIELEDYFLIKECYEESAFRVHYRNR